MEKLNLLSLTLGLIGGTLGAAIGALPAFILCGVSLIIGTILFLITGEQLFNNLITWGPVIGPHTAFSGGIAAAAWAARKGKLDSGLNIIKPLYSLKSFSVFFVGAIFGCLGLIFTWILTYIPTLKGTAWVNPIALSIVLNGILIRIFIGKMSLLGERKGNQFIFKPSPEEDTLPWHMSPLNLILVSFSISVIVAFLAVFIPKISGLIFGIAIGSFVLFYFGISFPVILHIVLAVQLVASSTGSILWGLTFGVFSALLAEINACLFLNRVNTHIDPAAAAITIVYSLYALLLYLNIFQLNYIYSIIVLLFVLLGTYLFLSRLKQRPT